MSKHPSNGGALGDAWRAQCHIAREARTALQPRTNSLDNPGCISRVEQCPKARYVNHGTAGGSSSKTEPGGARTGDGWSLRTR